MTERQRYRLFIDDERFPPIDKQPWVVVRTVEAAIRTVKALGLPEFISFDHDLGTGSDGKPLEATAFVRWLSEYVLDNRPDLGAFEFYVHSQNPVGKRNIEGALLPLIEHARTGYR